MRFLLIVGLAVLGLLLGLWLGDLFENRPPYSWERLPAPPGEIVELIPAGDPPLYIKTSNGTTYTFQRDLGWVEASQPGALPDWLEVQRPCDPAAPEFSWWSNPPRDRIDCLQETVDYIDGYIHYTFVLDADGSLWQTSLARNAYRSIFTQICVPSLGLFFGTLAGVVVAFISRKRNATRKAA